MDVRAWVVEQQAGIKAAIDRLQADLNANIGASQVLEALLAKLDEGDGGNSDLRD